MCALSMFIELLQTVGKAAEIKRCLWVGPVFSPRSGKVCGDREKAVGSEGEWWRSVCGRALMEKPQAWGSRRGAQELSRE